MALQRLFADLRTADDPAVKVTLAFTVPQLARIAAESATMRPKLLITLRILVDVVGEAIGAPADDGGDRGHVVALTRLIEAALQERLRDDERVASGRVAWLDTLFEGDPRFPAEAAQAIGTMSGRAGRKEVGSWAGAQAEHLPRPIGPAPPFIEPFPRRSGPRTTSRSFPSTNR